MCITESTKILTKVGTRDNTNMGWFLVKIHIWLWDRDKDNKLRTYAVD